MFFNENRPHKRKCDSELIKAVKNSNFLSAAQKVKNVTTLMGSNPFLAAEASYLVKDTPININMYDYDTHEFGKSINILKSNSIFTNNIYRYKNYNINPICNDLYEEQNLQCDYLYIDETRTPIIFYKKKRWISNLIRRNTQNNKIFFLRLTALAARVKNTDKILFNTIENISSLSHTNYDIIYENKYYDTSPMITILYVFKQKEFRMKTLDQLKEEVNAAKKNSRRLPSDIIDDIMEYIEKNNQRIHIVAKALNVNNATLYTRRQNKKVAKANIQEELRMDQVVATLTNGIELRGNATIVAETINKIKF